MALPNNKWDCPACTYLNWSSSSKCTLCGFPRSIETTPKATIAKIKSYTQNSPSISKSTPSLDKITTSHPISPGSINSGDKWICSMCTYKNTSKSSICSMCRFSTCPDDKQQLGSIKHHQPSSSPCIFDFASSGTTGAVGGVSCTTDPLDVGSSVKKHHKQRHPSENNRSKRWKCPQCTYDNYSRSIRCTLCGYSRHVPRSGSTSAAATDDTAGNIISRRVSLSKDEDLRQIRNRLSVSDLLFLNACEGVINGDNSPVKDYLKSGGDKLRQLTSKEILALGGGQSSKYTAGSSLIDLALRFHQSDILACLLTPAPIEAHKRLPSQSNIELAASVRSEVMCSLKQNEGYFPCYYFSTITTFALPSEVHSFCNCTQKKILEEVVDLDVLRVVEEENPVINWNNELVIEMNSKLYPLWNRTAGDCLLDSTLQATWGVCDRDGTLRKTLADSLTDCSTHFYKRWHNSELFAAETQGFSLDENQLKADWLSIVALVDQKGHSLDQTHVFVLAHILRRPIIVYSVKVVENFRGEKLGPVNYEGIYLPLLWDSSFCSTTPIALAYTRGHFSALVSIDSTVSCDDHVMYLPVVDNEGTRLPIHFLESHQRGYEDKLLEEYCDCFISKKGLWTVKQNIKPTDHVPQYVSQLVDNWLDRFYQLNKNCRNCAEFNK